MDRDASIKVVECMVKLSTMAPNVWSYCGQLLKVEFESSEKCFKNNTRLFRHCRSTE